MAHPPVFPTLSPPAHSWGSGSHKSLKTAGENCAEQASLAASAHRMDKAGKGRKPGPLTPCPVSAGVVGASGTTVFPPQATAKRPSLPKPQGGMLAMAPPHRNLGRDRHLFLSAQPDPYRSKLPSPGDGRGDTPATTVFFPLA